MPSNLLSNCKYLCKNSNKLCLDSCDLLLSQINKPKRGTCPSLLTEPANTIQLLISSKGNLAKSSFNQCSHETKQQALATVAKHNNEPPTETAQCTQDSECSGVKKCCQLQGTCPQHGSVCAKPLITNVDPLISPPPFNLSIIERKSGKTIILRWESTYLRNKPTLFVVEGRWSLTAPSTRDTDAHMTKWGYLAQTINNNWIILRNINRGRWYKFRVASVTKSGTQGYSEPTPLFILSLAPNAPSQPQNLTAEITHTSSKAQANLTWLPSRRSDLPITKYKVTWQQDNSNSPHYGYDFIQSNVNRYTITQLHRNAKYTVKVTAVSLYENKELLSKPQQVIINTADSVKSHASLLTSEPEYEDDNTDLQPKISPSNQISNLTVLEPYFRNGLVKAAITWSLSNQQTASINSLDQAMFTITWFPITCSTDLTLPTPITATTISTEFEIYELRYDCNYVVNVRLATKAPRGSTSLNPTPPQVASGQFRVPSCSQVQILGHIRPRCYQSPLLEPKTHLTTTKSMTTTPLQLPRVYNIRHRIVSHSSDVYSVEFTWSLNKHFQQQGRFNGYQISVVPRAIPGFTSSAVKVGSVGAIVDKEESSFVVKQLHSGVKYIFQIQLIALDNQSYGPASSLEFKINAVDFKRTTKLANRYYSVNNRQNRIQVTEASVHSGSARVGECASTVIALVVISCAFLW